MNIDSAVALRDTFVNVLINPLLLLIFALGLLVFVFGLVEFLWGAGKESEARTKGKQHMLYGIIGMFIMVSAYSIVRVIQNSFPTASSSQRVFDEGRGTFCPPNC